MIDLDYENSNKMNYLHLATERNHTYFLDVLLQHAQDSNKLEELIESRDKVGNTPYHYAAMKMNPKYNTYNRIKSLLSNKSNIDSTSQVFRNFLNIQKRLDVTYFTNS